MGFGAARGVACNAGPLYGRAPAWPVDDQAARTFAEELYQRLLGMEGQPAVSVSAKSMHVAMREARRAIQFTLNGARTNLFAIRIRQFPKRCTAIARNPGRVQSRPCAIQSSRI